MNKNNFNKVLAGEKVSFSEYLGYFSYGFGQCLSFGVVGTFLLIYYTDVFKISAIAASGIFFIARVWDAINDPLIASMMDERHKEGTDKFKPFLKLLPVFISLSTILLFVNVNFSYNLKVIYALITYILWGMLYTVSDISFWSISTVISNDSQERTKLITTANIGVFGGIGLAGALLPMFRTKLEQIFNFNPTYQNFWGVFLMMIILIPLCIYGGFTAKERVKIKTTEKVTFRKIFEAVKINKPLRIILVVYFLNIFMNIVQGMAPFFFKWNMNREDLFQFYSILSVCSALGFLILPILTKNFKKLVILKVLLAIDIILRSIFYFVGYSSPIFVVTMMGILFFIYALTAPILSVMIAETVEYAEYKTGIRTEAVTFSGQTFSGKLSVALAGTFSGLILSAINYNPELSTQSTETLSWFFIIIVLLPALGSLFRLIVLHFHTYDELEHEKILKLLKNKN